MTDLVHGKLTKDTWNDFVSRLKFDCIGGRVRDHCTADAMFIVENEKIVAGLDKDYVDQIGVYDDSCFYESIESYIDAMCPETKDIFATWLFEHEYDGVWTDDEMNDEDFNISNACIEKYLEEDSSYQDSYLTQFDQSDSGYQTITVTAYEYEWVYVCTHFTHAAAKRWIERKGHDYRKLRVFVDAQTYCWEFNEIKEAMMDGRIGFIDKEIKVEDDDYLG